MVGRVSHRRNPPNHGCLRPKKGPLAPFEAGLVFKYRTARVPGGDPRLATVGCAGRAAQGAESD